MVIFLKSEVTSLSFKLIGEFEREVNRVNRTAFLFLEQFRLLLRFGGDGMWLRSLKKVTL